MYVYYFCFWFLSQGRFYWLLKNITSKVTENLLDWSNTLSCKMPWQAIPDAFANRLQKEFSNNYNRNSTFHQVSHLCVKAIKSFLSLRRKLNWNTALLFFCIGIITGAVLRVNCVFKKTLHLSWQKGQQEQCHYRYLPGPGYFHKFLFKWHRIIKY